MEGTFCAKASHILIKHKNSSRPFDKVRNVPITRSLEEAVKILEEIRKNINTFEEFQVFAKE